MSLSIPRKKKLIRIIIIVASLVDHDLDNNVSDTLQEEILSQLGQADALLFSVPESQWGSSENDAWSAVENIYNAIQPEATSDPDWQSLSDNLGAALAEL